MVSYGGAICSHIPLSKMLLSSLEQDLFYNAIIFFLILEFSFNTGFAEVEVPGGMWERKLEGSI